jgi:hypothetical protein
MKPLDPIIARQLGIAPSDAKHKPKAERKLQQRLENRPARHYSMVGSWRASVDAKATMTRPAVIGLASGQDRRHAVRAKTKLRRDEHVEVAAAKKRAAKRARRHRNRPK